MRPILRVSLLLFAVLAGACEDGAPASDSGSALNSKQQAPSGFGIDLPIDIGSQVVLFSPPIRNTSDVPVTLTGVRMEEPTGVDSVVLLRSFEVARANLPGGIYSSYPPALFEKGRGCSVVDPKPVQGFVLKPGDEVLLLTRFEAIGSGSFGGKGFVVSYREDGESVAETFPLSISGKVESGAPGLPLDSAEEKCLEPTA